MFNKELKLIYGIIKWKNTTKCLLLEKIAKKKIVSFTHYLMHVHTHSLTKMYGFHYATKAIVYEGHIISLSCHYRYLPPFKWLQVNTRMKISKVNLLQRNTHFHLKQFIDIIDMLLSLFGSLIS